MSRLFGFLSVIIVMAIGLYIYSKQMQSSSAEAGATNPAGAINITGVKSDLISIASAERRYFATEGKYVLARRTYFLQHHHSRPPASPVHLLRRGQRQQLSRSRHPLRR